MKTLPNHANLFRNIKTIHKHYETHTTNYQQIMQSINATCDNH